MSTYEDGSPMAGYEHQRTDESTAPGVAPVRAYSPTQAAARAVENGSMLDQLLDDASAPKPTAAEADGAPKPSESESGLNFEDEWDKAPSERAEQQSAPEGFEKYRRQRGHALVAPEALAVDTRHTTEEIASVVKDAGIALAHAGLQAGTAQALFNVIAVGYEPPSTDGGFDFDRGLSEVRVLAGSDADKVVENAQRYVATRPALAAYLDETTLGNNPKVLMALAILQTRPSLSTKAGAEAYLAEMKRPGTEVNKAYFAADPIEVFAAKLAFAVSSGGK